MNERNTEPKYPVSHEINHGREKVHLGYMNVVFQSLCFTQYENNEPTFGIKEDSNVSEWAAILVACFLEILFFVKAIRSEIS